jgi:hypothetical protein
MPIGPSFGDELADAGLAGLPIAWNNDKIINDTDLTPDQKDKLQKVLNTHNPNKPSRLEAKQKDPEVGKFLEWLRTASFEDIDAWVDDNDASFVLKTIVKYLSSR